MKKVLLGITLLFVLVGCNDKITDVDVINEDSNNDILFYGFHVDSAKITSTYLMDIRENSIKKIADSYYRYPSWYSYAKKILLFNTDNYNIEIHDVEKPNDVTILVENIGNILFMRYSPFHDAVLFSYKQWNSYNQTNKIAYYDLKSNTINNFPIINTDAKNPIWAEKDNFIYFISKLDTTSSILKVSNDGVNLQIVLEDNELELSTFDISRNSELLVVSRYNKYKSYITVYKLETKTMLYNIDVSSLGMGLYPTFTSNSKKILFVNGIPNDYSTPRNIFIMNINGDDLSQLTFEEEYLYFRPLNW